MFYVHPIKVIMSDASVFQKHFSLSSCTHSILLSVNLSHSVLWLNMLLTG